MDDNFDLGAFDAQDEATLAIKNPKTGEPTSWVWTFYGPGHPETIKVADRASRKFLNEAREKEAAQVNGRKWKKDADEPDSVRKENVDNILDRTKTFTPVNLNGKPIEYSRQAAAELLLDRRKSWLYEQIADYLKADANFIRPSGKA
jgi:hypothetical protein